MIDSLASRDPKLSPLPAAATMCTPRPIADKAKARFAAVYSNVAFGWYIATSFADARVAFPICCPVGTDRWLFRAYLMRLHGDAFHSDHIVDAYAIAQLPEGRVLKGKLCSMLLAGCGHDPNMHRKAVADTTGIHLHTIEAFDVLFFNVIDRYKEAAYVSEHVYPHTRYVEFAEDYMRTADVSDLIKRAGFNSRDLSLSAFLSGMGDSAYLNKLSARADREQELTRHLMGNALLLAHSGALNNRNVGISRAQSLLAAQRQSGQVAETSPVADVSDYISDSLREALSAHDAQRLSMAVDDSTA